MNFVPGKCTPLTNRHKSIIVVVIILTLYIIHPYAYIHIKSFLYKAPELEKKYGDGDYTTIIGQKFYFKYASPICQNDSTTQLLILVFSLPENENLRTAIRDTWGSGHEFIKVVFVVSVPYPLNNKTNDDIQKEADTYQDIIQGNFLELDTNLIYKDAIMFKYVLYHCRGVKYIFKMEDNTIVNVHYFMIFIERRERYERDDNHILCNVVNSVPVHGRSSLSHCESHPIIYTFNVAEKLYKIIQKENFVDDVFSNVYLTGKLAKMNDINLLDIKDIMIKDDKVERIIEHQIVDTLALQSFMFAKNLEEYQIRILWSFVQLQFSEFFRPTNRYIELQTYLDHEDWF